MIMVQGKKGLKTKGQFLFHSYHLLFYAMFVIQKSLKQLLIKFLIFLIYQLLIFFLYSVFVIRKLFKRIIDKTLRITVALKNIR